MVLLCGELRGMMGLEELFWGCGWGGGMGELRR